MTNESDVEPDPELTRLLARWTAPVVPAGMDDKVLAAFRQRTGATAGFWARFFGTSIRVPVPVALGLGLLLLVTMAFALRPTAPPPTAGAPTGPEGMVQSAKRAEPPVVTPTSLDGFRPVAEVTATVVAAARVPSP